MSSILNEAAYTKCSDFYHVSYQPQMNPYLESFQTISSAYLCNHAEPFVLE